MRTSNLWRIVNRWLACALTAGSVYVFSGCGAAGGVTHVTPPTAQSHAHHVTACTQYDAAGECLVTPPPEPACDPLSPGTNCFTDGTPPQPSYNTAYIDQFGNACDPLSLKKYSDGTMQVCSMNPAYEGPTLLQMVPRGPPSPQCGMIYGVFNTSQFHQCYKGFTWIN